MATSTHTHDYMGRELANANPGVTNPVKDFVGRNTTSSVDYMGRSLQTIEESSSSSEESSSSSSSSS